MSDKLSSIERHNLSGEKTHTDYYGGNIKVGSSKDRTNLSGKYTHTDNYDANGNKTGTSKHE